MHFRVDITPPILRVLVAFAAVAVLDLLPTALRAHGHGPWWYMAFIYIIVGWALAMIEKDATCESGEDFTALAASWGSFVGLMFRGVFNLAHGLLHERSWWYMGVDTVWGVVSCVGSVLFLTVWSW